MNLLKWIKDNLQLLIGGFLVLALGIALNRGGCFKKDPFTEVDCAQFIENLPPELHDDINAGCNIAVMREWVTPFQVKAWFHHNRVVFVTVPFFIDLLPLGYVLPRSSYYEIFIMPQEDGLASSIMRRRVAFHEAIHIMLIIKGIVDEDNAHHIIMNEQEVCPGRCPDGILLY